MKSIIAQKNLHVVKDCGFCLHQNEERFGQAVLCFGYSDLKEELSRAPAGRAGLRLYVCALTTELYLFASCCLSSMAPQAAVSDTCRTSLVVLNTGRFPC